LSRSDKDDAATVATWNAHDAAGGAPGSARASKRHLLKVDRAGGSASLAARHFRGARAEWSMWIPNIPR
jgi:hypothetical protein